MKYSPSYNEFHSIQGRPLYHPTFQSPSINSYNSYNSLKPTITRSLNSSKLKFSSMNNTNNNTPSHTNIKTTKFNYHRKHDSYYKVSSQIELMNMKLSFDLLNHKIKQLNSIVLQSEKKIEHKRERSNFLNIRGVEDKRINKFIHYNPVFSPLSTYVNYLDNAKMKKNSDYLMYGNKKNEKDKYGSKDSIECDLSKIASELAETFEPSANTSKNMIVAENTLESDYLKEKKDDSNNNQNQHENDKNLQFLQDLIKTTKENLQKKEDSNEEINSLHTYSEDEKDTNKQSDSIKKDKFKSSNKTTSPKEEKKETEQVQVKKDNEEDHNKVFNKIQDLFKEDEDNQTNNEEVENEDNENQDENEEEEQNEKEENEEENQEEEDDEIEDQSKEENKTNEEDQLLSKNNSCKKLDFSDIQEEEKNKESSEKKSENPSENEEAEEDEDAIFAEIVQRAKELEEANQKNKAALEQTPLKCPIKPKKTVTFSEEKKVYIKFKENDQITKLSIYDSNGREAEFKPAKIETYLLNLKTPQKLKPIILVSSVPSYALQNDDVHTQNQKDDNESSKSCSSTPKKYKSPMKDANSPSNFIF